MGDENGYDATIQMPEGASTLAPHVDALYYDIFWISVVFFVAIVGAMVWFAWKFRRRPGVTSKPPGHHTVLELFWTFSPLILLAYMFHQGFAGFMMMAIPPETSINIRAQAYQWGWTFEQPTGLQEPELWVPLDEPVRLIMSSVPRGETPEMGAVLHSLFIPAFRVKRDVIPGMYTSLWFEANRPGVYDLYCTEYCGLSHSGMHTTVHVVPRDEWQEHLESGLRPPEGATYAEWGEQLFAANNCNSCHVVEPGAAATVGPNLSNVVGYDQPLEGGTSHMADLEYMRHSLREPGADVVRGYAGRGMPSFGGLSESQLDALVAYLASISDLGEPTITQIQELHPETEQ